MCLHRLSYCLGGFFSPLPLGKLLPFKNMLLFFPCSSLSHHANGTSTITFITLYFTYMLGQTVNSLGKGLSLNVIHI